MSMIKLERVDKIYNNGSEKLYALRNCNITIERGDFVILRGVSGSGKSTFLNILGTIDSPTNGNYYYEDVLVNDLNDEKKAELRRNKIGLIFQDYLLIQKQTVIYNVMVPLLFGKDPLKKCKEKALTALKRVGMEAFAKRKANTLSGGQRQRVAIARAIVNDPDLILADEPTGALDSENAESIFNIIKQINSRGTTVVLVTHNDSLSVENETCYYISDGVIATDKQ